MRDRQKSRVYRMDTFLRRHQMVVGPEGDEGVLDRPIIQVAVRQMCEFFEVEVPKVHFNPRKKNWAHYQYDDHTIRLPAQTHSWAHNTVVVAHETAHAVQRKLKEKDMEERQQVGNIYNMVEGHGPRFVAIHFQLLTQFTDLTMEELRNVARMYGVTVGSLFH